MKLYIYLILAVCLFIVSCEEDSYEVPKNSYRVTKISEYDQSEVLEYQRVLTYDGEKLITIMDYKNENDVLTEVEKTEFTYQNESAMGVVYIKNDDWKLSNETFYKISDGVLWKKEVYIYDIFDLKMNKTGEIKYNYSSGDLISTEFYSFNNLDGLELYEEEKYTYSNGQPSLADVYKIYEDTSTIIRQYEYYYEEDKLSYSFSRKYSHYIGSTKIGYDEDSVTKIEYTYAGDNLIESNGSVQKFTYYNNIILDTIWFEKDYLGYYYTYNENNCLTEVSQGSGSETIKYKYEVGHGNAGLILLSPVSRLIHQTPDFK